MEFTVEIGQGGTVLSEPASSPSAPNNLAGIQAREEYARIMSDPTHDKHAGYLRGDPTVEAYIDGLYKKAYPQTPPPSTPTDPAPIQEPNQVATMSPEDRVAQTETEAMLRQSFGDDYDSEMQNMRIGASHLFTSQESQKVLADFAQLITGLGPLAEVRGIRFLAEIGSLIKQHGGRL